MCAGLLCEPPASVRQHGGQKHASAPRRQFTNQPIFIIRKGTLGNCCRAARRALTRAVAGLKGCLLSGCFFYRLDSAIQARENWHDAVKGSSKGHDSIFMLASPLRDLKPRNTFFPGSGGPCVEDFWAGGLLLWIGFVTDFLARYDWLWFLFQ